MIYKMHLHNEPFTSIKNGTKKIELRLNDPKRQKLQINDYLVFNNRETSEIIITKIIALYKYSNFAEAFAQIPKQSLGYEEDEIANPQDMEKYYSLEEQNKYGILAIKLQLINPHSLLPKTFAETSTTCTHLLKRVELAPFTGYVNYLVFTNNQKPFYIDNVCLKDENYKWLQVYPDNEQYTITMIFDAEDNFIEWYFSIAKELGVENNIPYIVDLFLNFVVTKDGHKKLLTSSELDQAQENGIITAKDLEKAYQTITEIDHKYLHDLSKLIELTNLLCSIFNGNLQLK